MNGESENTDTESEDRGLFRMLGGTPAHGMVIIGVILALLAPLVPQCRHAGLADAEAALVRAEAIYQLDLDAFKEKQEEKREAEAEEPPTDTTLSEREDARETALKEKEESLKKALNKPGLTRDIVDARADAAGVRSHLYFHWIGRVLLILGFLAMTLNARGTRQKILLVVLLLVLFGSLTGVSLDVGANAHLGG